jgi:cleavage and polyadenylation specificity factor subunit 1
MERIQLSPIDLKKTFELYTDASMVAIGAVLKQGDNIIEFFSRKLQPTEQRYSAHEREALGMVASILHFKHMLIGAKFTLYTDHSSLRYWLKTQPVNERHARWLVKIQDMDFEVLYVKGEENVLADLMSRPTGVEVTPFADLQAELRVNAICTKSQLFQELSAAQTPEMVSSFRLPEGSVVQIDGLYQYVNPVGTDKNPRILVPESMREPLMKTIHELGHYGRKRTFNAVKQYYVWPGMRVQVNRFVQHCVSCQKNKTVRKQKRPWQSFPYTHRFKTVHVDIVGPVIPSSSGKRFMLTMMDRETRWIEVAPLRTVTAETVARAFYQYWVARYGVPEVIVTDQGAQFESDLFQDLMKCLSVKHRHTTPYHPQANGLIERLHSTLKASLRCIMDRASDWEKILPTTLLALRTAVNETGISPALMVFGETLSAPGALITRLHPEFQAEDHPEFVAEL